jgi:hypothetical protein
MKGKRKRVTLDDIIGPMAEPLAERAKEDQVRLAVAIYMIVLTGDEAGVDAPTLLPGVREVALELREILVNRLLAEEAEKVSSASRVKGGRVSGANRRSKRSEVVAEVERIQTENGSVTDAARAHLKDTMEEWPDLTDSKRTKLVKALIRRVERGRQ